MLDVVTFKWKPLHGYRSHFSPAAVNTLRAMVARHYQKPHRFTCITDDPAGLDHRVRALPLWPDHAEVLSPFGRQNPSCYRRLKIFSREARELIGSRILCMDLDAVVTGDLAPLFDRHEEFVMWSGTAGRNPYNGSMVMVTAGARPQLWEDFDPEKSPRLAVRAGFVGSDQAWIAYKLGPHEARWTKADGVYSWRMDVRNRRGALPKGARLVFFHGSGADPWQPYPQQLAPWIRDHWTIRPEEAPITVPREKIGKAESVSCSPASSISA